MRAVVLVVEIEECWFSLITCPLFLPLKGGELVILHSFCKLDSLVRFVCCLDCMCRFVGLRVSSILLTCLPDCYIPPKSAAAMFSSVPSLSVKLPKSLVLIESLVYNKGG
jgi:hypothetical protein